MTWDYSNFGQGKNSLLKPDFTEKNCCADVTGGEIVECDNNPVPIDAITTGAVAKIPVVLAEFRVQFNVDTIIELPEPALEIKDIKKRLKIVQCILLQNTNMLFIKGFVRKNIDYSTRKCSNSEGICGDIRHCTVDIPFKCTTPVTFNGIEPLPVVPTSRSEFEYFKRQDLKGPQFADKDELLSGDLSEFNQTSTEFFNELPFCELISSRIVEFDEFINPLKLSDAKENFKKDSLKKDGFKAPFEEREFKKIEEKMVIFLTLKLLQNRQVAIGAFDPDC